MNSDHLDCRHSGSGLHYGWVIVLTGALTVFACLGLARFAFGMFLPSMSISLNLSYDQMGFLGTGNFAGYLLAVTMTPFILRRLSPRQMIASGLFLIAVCMFGIAASQGYRWVLVLYFIVGLGSGFANIPVMVLVSYWFRSQKRGRAAGLIVVGSGFAIMFSGYIVPVFNRSFEQNGWRVGWVVLGAIVMLVALLTAVFVRNDPEEKGLSPIGSLTEKEYDPSDSKGPFSPAKILVHLGGLYFIFGATYVIYGTFIVTTMVEEYAYAEGSAGWFWAWVGFFSLFSGTVFGLLSDKIGRKKGLMAVFAVQTLAYSLAGSQMGTVALFGSVFFYGIAVFAIPAIMAAAVGDYLGKSKAASGFSIITICFAVGQTIGPAVAGVVAESLGTFTVTYLAAAVLTFIAVFWTKSLPLPQKHT